MFPSFFSRCTSKCEAEVVFGKVGTFTNLGFAHTEEETRLDGYLQLMREQETCGKTNEAKKLGISLSCVLSPNKVYKAYYRTDMGQISKRFIGASASYSLPKKYLQICPLNGLQQVRRLSIASTLAIRLVLTFHSQLRETKR